MVLRLGHRLGTCPQTRLAYREANGRARVRHEANFFNVLNVSLSLTYFQLLTECPVSNTLYDIVTGADIDVNGHLISLPKPSRSSLAIHSSSGSSGSAMREGERVATLRCRVTTALNLWDGVKAPQGELNARPTKMASRAMRTG